MHRIHVRFISLTMLPNTCSTRTRTDPGAQAVDLLLMRCQREITIAFVMDAAAMAAHLQLLLQDLRTVGTVGPYPAIVLIRSQDLG